MANKLIVSSLNNQAKSKVPPSQNKNSIPKEVFNNFNSPDKLANELQDYIDRIVSQCSDVDWDENFLSYQIVKAIRVVLDGYILPNTNLSKFDVEAYKLTGNAEQTHGDIGVVVSKTFEYGYSVAGVGFYEAKASSLNGYDYPAFSFQQLRRLVTNTPKLSYLLYERQSQIADTQEWATLEKENKRHFFTRVIDANLIKQYKYLADAAHSMSQSFGYHFVYKILSGRELDYSRLPIDTIRRWLKVTRRSTAFVISISVRESEKEHFHTQLELPNFHKMMLPLSVSNDIYIHPKELLE